MLSDEDRNTLLEVARNAVSHELLCYVPLNVDPQSFSASLGESGAAFVTLKLEGRLRGCIGSLEPRRPLVTDVARNAGAAAFADPRFARLSRGESERVDFHISVIGPHEPISFSDEADLIGQLRPGIDGLVLREGQRRGTFLPDVWRDLADPQQFLQHLKRKAGLDEDHWSDSIQVDRYTTESFP